MKRFTLDRQGEDDAKSRLVIFQPERPTMQPGHGRHHPSAFMRKRYVHMPIIAQLQVAPTSGDIPEHWRSARTPRQSASSAPGAVD